MKMYKILLFVLLNLSINVLSFNGPEIYYDCEIPIPTSCVKRDIKIYFDGQVFNYIICSIKEGSQLRFDIDEKNWKINQNRLCKPYIIVIKPGLFESNVKLSRKSIDVKSLVQYVSKIYNYLEFDSLQGFDLQLFQGDEKNKTFYIKSKNNLRSLWFKECSLRFYIGDKQMKSCQDYYDPVINFTTPRSIFHLYNNFSLYLTLSDLKEKICPLAFKNVIALFFNLKGDNSYFSQRLIKFSNETFADLNTTITKLEIEIGNVEVDFKLVHPSVFKEIKSIIINNKIKSIHPDLFLEFKRIKRIDLYHLEFKSLIHKQGIDWIKNINRDLKVNLSDQIEVKACFKNKSAVFIRFLYRPPYFVLRLDQIFPDEDFCIYREFPFNQMVIFIIRRPLTSTSNLSCTYLWLIQYYKIYNVGRSDYEQPTDIHEITYFSEEYKSISKCNFEHRISLCNKSNFHIKPIISYYDIGQSMIWTKSIINIASYFLCIFGFVTNLLVIITISSKKNKAEFKDFNQYKYMRINSICSCLLLSIHVLSWITDCNYPYGIFCSKVRKTYFFQYLKIIVGQILATSLRFMINFLYIAFSFCRLALIGKEPNKFVKFMSEIGIKKYVFISLLISLVLSAVKYFSYRINNGMIDKSYPINYDYQGFKYLYHDTKIYFIINFISDLMNYVVFILIHMSMDIGMVIKLRKTLNERLEKSKEFSTKEQQEKKETENESVFQNAISMVIWNTVVGVLLKIPTCIYSLVFMHSVINKSDRETHDFSNRLSFFILNVCSKSYFCEMFFTLADFLYLLYISIQFFFYKRFDKKFKIAFKRIFAGNESNTVK